MNQRRAELVDDIGLPAIPQYWEELVAACLKKLPEQRPPTMREIGDYLVSWSQQPDLPGPPPVSEQDLAAAENARLAEETHLRGESERQERGRQPEIDRIREQEAVLKQEADLNRQRQLEAAREQERKKKELAVKSSTKSKPLPWIIAAFVVLSLVAWVMVSSNKPHQTSTVSVTNDAAIQRERQKTEAAAAQAWDAEQRASKAEQEKLVLAAQAKAREDAGKQAAERKRLADLAEKEKLALIAQAKASEVVKQAAEPTNPTPRPSESALKYLDTALKEVKDFRGPSEYTEALCKIAEAKYKVGEVEASRAIFAQLKKWALTLPTVFTQDSVVAFGRIAQSESLAGDRDAARNTLKEAVAKLAENADIFSRSMAMSRIGEAQMVMGDSKESLITFGEADKTASRLKGHSKNWCLIENLIIRSQAEARSGSREAAKEKLVRAATLVESGKEDLLAKIALSQAKIGDMEGARETFGKSVNLAMRMKDTYEKGSALRNIASDQAESGDIAEARITASKILDRYNGGKYAYKEEALAAIADVVSASERARFMADVLEQAKNGKATTAEAAVKGLARAEDRCFGFIQIALGLLSK